MTGLRTEHCVEIRVPLNGSEALHFGSGYALAPHWVLTAWHVLFPTDYDPDGKITVMSAGKAHDDPPCSRKDIVWCNKEHDIAVMRCETLAGEPPIPWVTIGQQRLSPEHHHASCHAAGYLAKLHNQQGGQRKKKPKGTFGAFSDDRNTVDIDDLNIQMQDTGLWQGFSGSPVFSPISGPLVGVARLVNTGERNSLVASLIVPALDAKGDKEGQGQGRLRDLPGFLQPPDNSQCWGRLQKQVIARLEQDSQLKKALSDSCQQYLPPDSSNGSCEQLAENLYQLSETHLVNSFLATFGILKSAPNVDGLQGLQELALIWLALFAAGTAAQCDIDAFKASPEADPLALQAVEPILVDVESQLAEAESGEPILRNNGRHLRSPLDLTPDHDTGFDEHSHQADRDTRSAYQLNGQPGMEAFTADAVKQAVEDHVTGGKTGISAALTSEPQRGLVYSGLLAQDRMVEKRSPYIRIPAERQGEDLQELHGWCPELLLIQVNQREDLQHMLALSGLNRIIHVVQELLAPP